MQQVEKQGSRCEGKMREKVHTHTKERRLVISHIPPIQIFMLPEAVGSCHWDCPPSVWPLLASVHSSFFPLALCASGLLPSYFGLWLACEVKNKHSEHNPEYVFSQSWLLCDLDRRMVESPETFSLILQKPTNTPASNPHSIVNSI